MAFAELNSCISRLLIFKNSAMKISSIRKDYFKDRLSEHEAGFDPLVLFGKWLDDAVKSGVCEPTAMVLSTISHQGYPSSRVVLLKGIDNGRLLFYTNFTSNKGRHLSENPRASLLFFWGELERQVRFEGNVTQLPAKDSDEYFLSRPYESRIGALVSRQSTVIADREELDREFARLFDRMKANQDEIRRPEYWGGYALDPVSVEFWQGRANRLHDRLRYNKAKDNWIRERLSP